MNRTPGAFACSLRASGRVSLELSSVLLRDRRTRCQRPVYRACQGAAWNGAACDPGYCAMPYKWRHVRIAREQARDSSWGPDVRSRLPLGCRGPVHRLIAGGEKPCICQVAIFLAGRVGPHFRVRIPGPLSWPWQLTLDAVGKMGFISVLRYSRFSLSYGDGAVCAY